MWLLPRSLDCQLRHVETHRDLSPVFDAECDDGVSAITLDVDTRHLGSEGHAGYGMLDGFGVERVAIRKAGSVTSVKRAPHRGGRIQWAFKVARADPSGRAHANPCEEAVSAHFRSRHVPQLCGGEASGVLGDGHMLEVQVLGYGMLKSLDDNIFATCPMKQPACLFGRRFVR